MSDVLDFAGVGVARGTSILLDDVTWQVEEGERWVILGPNGAGKTTLLQLAAARMHPTRGTATVLGERLGRVDVFELRPRIGLASAALAERIPGGELVRDVVLTASYGVVGRWRESYERMDVSRARRLLNALGAEHLSERTYGTLSEGECKRVLIARALMTDPELMLLDEPAAGLDLAGREDLLNRLGQIAADLEAPALVLVTHHVEEIPPGITDVLLLREGRVIASGPIERTLTEQNLSVTFGLPLQLERHEERWSARARPAGDASAADPLAGLANATPAGTTSAGELGGRPDRPQ